MSSVLGKLDARLEKRMGPVAKKLDKVLEETKKQTKVLEEIRDLLKVK